MKNWLREAYEVGTGKLKMKTVIDHLVVTAASREIGINYVSERLGVTPQLGGEHVTMGTHNALLRLGDAAYLEVIAINPDAPAPPRPRWFGLDNPELITQPRLLTWVVRTDDIYGVAARASVRFGPVEAMSRGALNWLITIPPDGSLLLDGSAPNLIQWLSDAHPSAALCDSGCELLALEVRHPEAAALKTILEQIGFEGPLVASQSSTIEPKLIARIKTPHGIREL